MSYTQPLIDCEEDRTLRAVLVGMLRDETSGRFRIDPRSSSQAASPSHPLGLPPNQSTSPHGPWFSIRSLRRCTFHEPLRAGPRHTVKCEQVVRRPKIAVSRGAPTFRLDPPLVFEPRNNQSVFGEMRSSRQSGLEREERSSGPPGTSAITLMSMPGTRNQAGSPSSVFGPV